MNVIFAGTSHGIPEFDRFCSSTIVCVKDRTYIIDAGAPISQLVRRYGRTHESVKGIFLTHSHGDHCAGLFEFCDQITWYFKEAKPEIYLPEPYLKDLIDQYIKVLLPDQENRLDLRTYTDGFVFDDGVVRLSVRRTKHIANSFSFLFEAEGKKILFTGDMSYGLNEYHDVVGDEHYDLVIPECAHHNTGDLAGIIKNTNTDRMIVNHINPVKGKVLEDQLKGFPFPARLGYDGLTIEL